MTKTGNTDDIACQFREVTRGGLRCTVADCSLRNTTDKTTREICASCHVGRVYREIGCDQLSPQTLHLIMHGQGIFPQTPTLFCERILDTTTLENCKSCTLATAETTKEVIASTVGLLHSEEFESTLDDFEKARKALRDCECDAVIRSSISMLESAMKSVQERMVGSAEGNNVTDLWRSTGPLLRVNEIGESRTPNLGGQLAGVISSLGGLRNSLSDAHGDGDNAPEVPAMLAEFVFNTSCGLVTLVVRRYTELKA